ncbi:uncharacterized protein LOC62_07G009775 [Vanrija pseudolonga]|uniref:Methanethiol oxidase n=1 Tax=Vanrija pseudolonga TaxID=143232 RepID=A0AAF1BRV6_9TREE|nr:hypothetical protein LOC62_07G009775 [Vanrija pseudolonga]
MKLQHALTVLFALSSPAFAAVINPRQQGNAGYAPVDGAAANAGTGANAGSGSGQAGAGSGAGAAGNAPDGGPGSGPGSGSGSGSSVTGAPGAAGTDPSGGQSGSGSSSGGGGGGTDPGQAAGGGGGGNPGPNPNAIGPAGASAAPGKGAPPPASMIPSPAVTQPFPTTAGPLPNPNNLPVPGKANNPIPSAPPPPAPTVSQNPAPADVVAQAGANAPNVAASLASSANAVLQTGGSPGIVGGGPQAAPPVGGQSSQYLYVWCGAEGRVDADRIVTLDFDPNSPNYGRPISQTLVSSGNEPHHCGLSNNGRTMVCGGFLSQFKGQNELFVFDVGADPANPKWVANNRGGYGNVPDEVFPLNDGTFFVTEMGNNWGGGYPGRLAHLDENGNLIAEYPPNPPPDFLPHGIDVRSDLNLLVTSDFLNIASAFNSVPGDPVTQASVRVWNLATMQMSPYKIPLPSGTASMELRLLKHDPRGRGFVGGTGTGKVYLFDPFYRVARQVIDVNDQLSWLQKVLSPKITAQMKQVSEDDRFLYLLYASDFDKWTKRSGFYSGVAVFDITNPETPVLIQDYKLPAYAGPHLIKIYGNRLAITDYFLNLDNFGKVHADGDRHVRVFNIGPDGRIIPDPRFQVPFSQLIPGVNLRPHGLAAKVAR